MPLLRIKSPHLPHGHEPGFLHHVVGLVAPATAAPQHEPIQRIEMLQAPRATGCFIAGQHRFAQHDSR